LRRPTSSLNAALRRRLAKLADRHDDAQPSIGAIIVPLAPRFLHILARLCGRLIAVKLDEELAMSRSETGMSQRYAELAAASKDAASAGATWLAPSMSAIRTQGPEKVSAEPYRHTARAC
jgi:hypothetical protein